MTAGARLFLLSSQAEPPEAGRLKMGRNNPVGADHLVMAHLCSDRYGENYPVAGSGRHVETPAFSGRRSRRQVRQDSGYGGH